MPSNDRHCPLLILSHLHSFWEKNCNSANSSGQLGNGIASSWQGWFISANTIVLASSRLFRSPWFLSRIFFSKRPTARIHGSGEPVQRLSLWKRISDIETGAPVRSLGSRAFFDPSTDNRHFSDCVTFVFPAVFHVRRHTQILGVWRAESFLSCGYFPVFLVSIHLGSGIWDLGSDKQWAAETSLKSLSSVSDASSCRLPSGILLLIRLHHVFCFPLQRYHHHRQNIHMCVLQIKLKEVIHNDPIMTRVNQSRAMRSKMGSHHSNHSRLLTTVIWWPPCRLLHS